MKVVVEASMTVSFHEFGNISPNDFRQLLFKGVAPEVDQQWYVVYGIPSAQKWAWTGIIGENPKDDTFMALLSSRR